MVRTRSGPTEYKFVASKRCPNGELPSDPLTDRHRQTPKLCKKPLSQFIIAPRAQASRRCETQASLSGKAAKLWLAFRSLDLFRALREPDRRRRDEKRPCRSEQKTATNQNDYLTGKAPYKSCELAISRRIADCFFGPSAGFLPTGGQLVQPSTGAPSSAAPAPPPRLKVHPGCLRHTNVVLHVGPG